MRMRAKVLEDDAQPLAFGGAQRRAGHAAVEGPGREHDARRDLDLLVLGGHLEGAQRAAVGQRSRPSRFPVGQHRGRIEAVAGVVDSPTVIIAPCAHVAGLAARLRCGRSRHSFMAGRHCLAGSTPG